MGGKKNLHLFELEGNKGFSSGISTNVDWEPRSNILDCGDKIFIEIELPGVKREDVFIELEGEYDLIISGVKKQIGISDKKYSFYLFEREFGRFFKRIILDFLVDIDGISTRMELGVLFINLPKKKSKIDISIEEEGDQDE